VVVAVVDVNHVESFLTDEAAEPSEVGEDGDRARPDIEIEPLDGLHAGFARLGLELVSRSEAEQRVVAAGAESESQPERGIGAARPPAVGHEVEDAKRPVACHASPWWRRDS
jgi:hypothetical protein